MKKKGCKGGKGQRQKQSTSTSSYPTCAGAAIHTVDVPAAAPLLPPGVTLQSPRPSPSNPLQLTEHHLFRAGEAFVTAVCGVLSAAESGAWFAWAEGCAFEPATQRAGAGKAHRDCSRLVLDDPVLAQQIWQRVRAFVPKILGEPPNSPRRNAGAAAAAAAAAAAGAGADGSFSQQPRRMAVGCLPTIRLYRYDLGQSFGKHIDGCTDAPQISKTARTGVTLLIYLNSAGGDRDAQGESGGGGLDPLEGGATVFFRGKLGTSLACSVAPRAGTAVLHSHGERCLLHEGARVTRGVKFILRTDIVYDVSS